MKHVAQAITDNYNASVGAVIAVISVIFGERWYLFTLFLTPNTVDWVTGWMKSRTMKKENSVKDRQGVFKKIGHWVMITFTFMATTGLAKTGEIIGTDLQITTLLGRFVLASLTVSEARSICENFAEAGSNVPKVLSDGLAVADKLINKESEDEE